MSRIGLALSGGGFRATLYHLGILRFLRDANILPRVSHITSVSGGSIMAAHLVMNWHRYTGSDQDYEEAAKELLDFIRLDIRNRVVRRFPLAWAANGVRWAARQGRSRRLTRPGLLEAHYEKYLYGDKCLFELPDVPQLHILATNINEGCLCSFTRSGLLLQRRMPGGGTRFEPVPSALATVPMAVTASSAFPGFFPPLQLTAQDVGADESQFPPHLFTDGGVYDNLGVRMFRHIQESWMAHDSPLRADDFVDLRSAAEVLDSAEDPESRNVLRQLAQLVRNRTSDAETAVQGVTTNVLPQSLWNVIVHEKLYRNSAFKKVELEDEHAANLHHLARQGRELDTGDHLWLNRSIVNAAYRKAIKTDLLTSTQTKFDAVVVSDAGKQFTVSRRIKSGGLVGTAMRASDILMNRVWQLENDHFATESDFVFAPMSLTVHLAEDPYALHPEVQHQVTNTRTDLDQFSELEMSGLIRHGYGVMRKVCRTRPDLFGEDLPAGSPWDPISMDTDGATTSPKATSRIAQHARELQGSAQRKVLGRLLSLRDWPTYVFLPLIILLLVGVPYYGLKAYRNANRSEMIVDAITFSNPDFQLVLQLARQEPATGDWQPVVAEEVSSTEIEPPNISDFRLTTDTRIFDLRALRPGSTDVRHQMVAYRRMLVRRREAETDADIPTPQEPPGTFRFQQFGPTRDVAIRFDPSGFNPTFRMARDAPAPGENRYLFDVEFDLSNVPKDQNFEFGFEVTMPGMQGRTDNDRRLDFQIVAPTDVATMWVLLPEGRPYQDFEVIAYDTAAPAQVDLVEPTYLFEMADGSVFGWMIVAPRDRYVYECRWTWRND